MVHEYCKRKMQPVKYKKIKKKINKIYKPQKYINNAHNFTQKILERILMIFWRGVWVFFFLRLGKKKIKEKKTTKRELQKKDILGYQVMGIFKKRPHVFFLCVEKASKLTS